MMWLLWAVVEAGRPPHRDVADPAADIEAIRRAASGDADALAVLYDRHVRSVYSLAFRIIGDASDAEEVVQDVFAQVWKQASRYDTSRGVVIAWMLMMTRSRAIDRIRARRGLPPAAPDS